MSPKWRKGEILIHEKVLTQLNQLRASTLFNDTKNTCANSNVARISGSKTSTKYHFLSAFSSSVQPCTSRGRLSAIVCTGNRQALQHVKVPWQSPAYLVEKVYFGYSQALLDFIPEQRNMCLSRRVSVQRSHDNDLLSTSKKGSFPIRHSLPLPAELLHRRRTYNNLQFSVPSEALSASVLSTFLKTRSLAWPRKNN